jgi:hypothetical protein
MKVGGYQLCELLSASEVGTRYRATSRGSDALVEIVLLRCDDAQAVSWHDTCKRWQTAALIESTAVRRIEALELDAKQPFVVLEWLAGPSMSFPDH